MPKQMYIKQSAVFIVLSLFCLNEAFASTTGGMMPWDTGLSEIQGWLTGDLVHYGVVIVIAMSGLSLAFGEAGGFFRRAAGVVFGMSLAMGAATVATSLGIAGAVI